MTKYRLFIVLAAWIICGIIAGLVQAPKRIDAQNRDTPDREAKRAAFQKIRGQLETKGVPFDPEVLLEPTWREEVKRVVDTIPEMSDKRVLGEKVKGGSDGRNPLSSRKSHIDGRHAIAGEKDYF